MFPSGNFYTNRRVCQHYLPIDTHRERNMSVSVLALKLWSHCETGLRMADVTFLRAEIT